MSTGKCSAAGDANGLADLLEQLHDGVGRDQAIDLCLRAIRSTLAGDGASPTTPEVRETRTRGRESRLRRRGDRERRQSAAEKSDGPPEAAGIPPAWLGVLGNDGSEPDVVPLRLADALTRPLISAQLKPWLGLLRILVENGLELPRSGYLNEQTFLQRLHEECADCQRTGRSLSLIGLESPGAGNAEGAAADSATARLARDLRELLRLNDTVALCAGGVRCLLPDTDSLGAEVALARIQKELPRLRPGEGAETGLPWTAACVTACREGVTALELLAELDGRLANAGHNEALRMTS